MTNRKSVSAQSLSANPFGVTTKRKGRCRKQGVSAFNPSIVPERLTREQLEAARQFYQSNAAQEIQFRRLCREWGCG